MGKTTHLVIVKMYQATVFQPDFFEKENSNFYRWSHEMVSVGVFCCNEIAISFFMRTKFWVRGEEYKNKNDDNGDRWKDFFLGLLAGLHVYMCFDKIVSSPGKLQIQLFFWSREIHPPEII